ncbi:MAG: signal recognition particle protein [Pseudomonadota bacterium]|nr:signal recognition particle protein [Pseudomonadota bacterium]
MFESLSDRLSQTLRGLAGKRLTEANIQDALRNVRRSLLEADVALDVVSSFIAGVRQRAIGEKIESALNAHDAFVKIVHGELVELMGITNDSLNLAAVPPVVILMTGLQGAGKTTTVAKLARYLRERERKQVAVVSADIYRPAAIDQLRRLAEEVQARFIASTQSESPLDIVNRALSDARTQFDDVLIVDTAGRTSVDEEMMMEISSLHQALNPVETLFVVDAMTGQDAAVTSKAFDEAVPLTGVILTKADGDARGGAALSVRSVTGKPVKFLGTGEKSDGLEAFHPDRIASRILGMGDVLTLIEEVERKVDKKKTSRMADKIKRGRKFDLVDFREQLGQMAQLGGMSNMLDKLPGTGGLPVNARGQVDDDTFAQLAVMIDSMTVHERRFPDVINGSRKRRIASGSGTQIQDVNRLLKQHKQMQKMMKKVGRRGGMEKMMRALGQGQPAQGPQRRR